MVSQQDKSIVKIIRSDFDAEYDQMCYYDIVHDEEKFEQVAKEIYKEFDKNNDGHIDFAELG